jgi:hypothetical protein
MSNWRESGSLLIPVSKTPKPTHAYGPLEVQGEEERKEAARILLELWNVLDLRRPPGRFGSGCERARYDAHEQAWYSFGKMILGEDCPEEEVLC